MVVKRLVKRDQKVNRDQGMYGILYERVDILDISKYVAPPLQTFRNELLESIFSELNNRGKSTRAPLNLVYKIIAFYVPFNTEIVPVYSSSIETLTNVEQKIFCNRFIISSTNTVGTNLIRESLLSNMIFFALRTRRSTNIRQSTYKIAIFLLRCRWRAT